MKKLLCLYLVLSYWLYGSAQPDSTIYGLNMPYPPLQDIYFSKIDPFTGNLTHISSVPVSTYYTFGGSTIDVRHGIYYFVSGAKLTGVNLQTGAVVSDAWINNTNGDRFEYCFYNCKDSTIYGLVSNAGRTELRLGKINPFTGTVTNISPAPIAANYLLGGYTLDMDRGIYYFLSDQHEFTGVDIHTGLTVSHVTIAGFDEFVEFAYNCRDSAIYGLARNAVAVAEIYLAKINPLTGTLNLISAAPFDISFQLDGITIDPYKRSYYVGTPMFVLSSVNMDTGDALNVVSPVSVVGGYFAAPQCGYTCCVLPAKEPAPENHEAWPQIPNVFTPNGDGINDVIRVSFPYPTKISVYNRWGQQVYSIESKQWNWNGLDAGGDKLSGGTYYIIAEMQDEKGQTVKTGKSILLVW